MPGPEFQSAKIELDKLVISRSNLRRREILAGVDELARSMNDHGLQHPIVVQGIPNGKFEIIIGQRRFLAAKQLGWKEIDARIVKEPLDEFQSKVVSFSENIQRRDLSPRDKADACSYLLTQLGSTKAVAEKLGITEQTVRKWLGYAAVPESLKVMVEQGDITARLATRLAQNVLDAEKAVAIARRMVETDAPRPERERIVAAAEESPDRPIAAILRRAEEKKHDVRIIVILPEQWALALNRAAKSLNTAPADLAKDAVIAWLDSRRY